MAEPTANKPLRKPLQILLAEDCMGDVMLIRKALERINVPTELNVVENGEQLLQYLVEALDLEQNDSKRAFPDVVMLDLNMPKLDGFKALEILSAKEGCNTLPMVVVSSSSDPQDIQLAFDLGAAAYIEKSPSFTQLNENLRFIERLWRGDTLFADGSKKHLH